MALRAGHGKQRGSPRIEVLPVDELPVGVPGPAREEKPTDRDPTGAFRPGNSLAAEGGRARKGQTRLADRLGIAQLASGNAFAPYKKAAAAFRRMHCTLLARDAGGGQLGPAPSSLVATAALQLAWSRYLSDLAAESFDPAMAVQASRLGDASRQSLLAAHELAVLEAKGRANRATSPVPWLLAPTADEGKP